VQANAVRQAESSAQPNLRIGEGCRVKGELVLSGVSEIYGQAEGIIVAHGELYIGPEAIVCGEISAETLRIAGSVVGPVKCSARLEMLSGARVAGNVTTPVLGVQDGVQYAGECRMPEPKSAADSEGAPPLELTFPMDDEA
jgi:cytoskeletal protein CcmA (bactofilin family)